MLTAAMATSLYLIMLIIFGVKNLSWEMQTFIIERFIPLISYIIMAPFFQNEKGKGMMEVLYSKQVSPVHIYLVRYILRFLLIGFYSGMYILLIENDVSGYAFQVMWFHSLSLGMFLGNMALLVHVIFKSEIIAYCLPSLFFISQLLVKDQYFKNFYMAKWTLGQQSSDELFILTSILSVLVSFYMLKKIKGFE